jgi:hypothetical protein
MAQQCECRCGGECRVQELIERRERITPELAARVAPGCEPEDCLRKARPADRSARDRR